MLQCVVETLVFVSCSVGGSCCMMCIVLAALISSSGVYGV